MIGLQLIANHIKWLTCNWLPSPDAHKIHRQGQVLGPSHKGVFAVPAEYT